MNTLLRREVYIRLADDESGFVCTVQYGKFHAKATEFALHCESTPGPSDEKVPVFARRRPSRWAESEER